MKKSVLSLVLVSIFILSAGMFAIQAEAAEHQLRFGMAVGQNDPMYKGAERFAENVEERTNGDVVVEIYPDGMLGSTSDMQEQAKMGANVSSLTDPGRLSDIVKDVGILNMAYIAKNYEEARKLVLSDWFKSMQDQLQEKGYVVLSMNWYQGARHFILNEKVEKPEDLNGLRIRTPGAAPWSKSIAALGADPTALDWSEVYTGLQQGVIDGAEAQHPATYGSSLYEVADYIIKTGHFQLMTGPVVGAKWFNSLPEEYQKIVKEEAVKAGDYASEIVLDKVESLEKDMEEEGMEIVEVDKTPFQEASEEAYKELDYNELRKKLHSEVLNR